MMEEVKDLSWLDDVEDKEEDINSSVLVSAAKRLSVKLYNHGEGPY